MAVRTVFYIKGNQFQEKNIDIFWHKGFADSQKQKNIESMHDEISKMFKVSKDEILEVSTKSRNSIGRKLSAMNLKITVDGSKYTFESVYQSSKVFDQGILEEIHHPEWIKLSGIQSKKESRKIGLPLKRFQFKDKHFSLKPEKLFYDWLYIKALSELSDIYKQIKNFKFFTDIEFNPNTMISCQAGSLAKFKFLYETNQIEDYLDKPEDFYK